LTTEVTPEVPVVPVVPVPVVFVPVPVVFVPVPAVPVPVVFVPVPVVLAPVSLSMTALVPTPTAAPANALVKAFPILEPVEVFAVVVGLVVTGVVVLAAPVPVEVNVFAGVVVLAAPVPVEVRAGFFAPAAVVALVNDGALEVAVFAAPVEVVGLGAAAPAAFVPAKALVTLLGALGPPAAGTPVVPLPPIGLKPSDSPIGP
jgi:hypothetical protein